MKIAVPVTEDEFCSHFGHCQFFNVYEVDREQKRIVSCEQVAPPPHKPGALPKFLHQQGVEAVLAGGMGQRARTIFEAFKIESTVGVNGTDPEQLVLDYMNGTLDVSANHCHGHDHGHGHGHEDGHGPEHSCH